MSRTSNHFDLDVESYGIDSIMLLSLKEEEGGDSSRKIGTYEEGHFTQITMYVLRSTCGVGSPKPTGFINQNNIAEVVSLPFPFIARLHS